MSYQLTNPLTTIFTPPASCVSDWTFEGSFYNSITGGILIQNAVEAHINSPCFPPGFSAWGRKAESQVFSPAICPSGFMMPAILQNAGTTTAQCCLPGFSFYSTITTVNYGETNSVIFQGCLSTFSGTTTVLQRIFADELNTTVVTGPLTMWGQPIAVQFQQQDLSLFMTTTGSSTAASSATAGAVVTTTSALVTTIGNQVTTIATLVTTTIGASATNNPSVTSNADNTLTIVGMITSTSTSTGSTVVVQKSGISSGAIAGIVAGSIVLLLLLLIALALLWRRRRQRAEASMPALPPKDSVGQAVEIGDESSEPKELPPTGKPSELPSLTKPSELSGHSLKRSRGPRRGTLVELSG